MSTTRSADDRTKWGQLRPSQWGQISPSFLALAYADQWTPKVLRNQKNSSTQGLAAMNFGVSKGSTFDRVLIFPTAPMRSYLDHRDPAELKRPESLYVAVTRARFSAAFVV